MKTISCKFIIFFMMISMSQFVSAELACNKSTMTFYCKGARKKIDPKKYNEIICLIIGAALKDQHADVKSIKKAILTILKAHKSPTAKQVLCDIRSLSIKNKTDFDKLYKKLMS